MVRKVHNDSWLRARAPSEYPGAARLIGGGDLSRGLRIAIREAAHRRGLNLEGEAAPERGGEAAMVITALYHGGSQLIAALDDLKFPSYARDIAARAGIRRDIAARRLEELSALGLVEEKPQGSENQADEAIYRLTDPGKYVAYVIEVLDKELPLVRKEGMKNITAYHLSLVKRITGKQADIKKVVERIGNTADLMKTNTEALLRLIS